VISGKVRVCLAILLVCACAGAPAAPDERPPDTAGPLPPPVAPKIPFFVTSPNGNRADDYYWLRDDQRKSVEVLDYLTQENAYRDAWMAPARALQARLRDELIARLKQDDDTVPVHEHGYWYYQRFEAGGEFPLYCRRKGSLQAAEQIMLHGNALARGHDYFSIGATAVSPDGRLLAYTQDLVGRRQYVLSVRNLQTGELAPDRIENIEPEVAWAADGRTLLYIEKDPVTLLSVRVRRHVLGTDVARDPLVYEETDHSYYVSIGKSRSEKYIFINLQSTQQSEWRYADAADPLLRFVPVLPREAGHEYHVEHLGSDFIIRTNWQAPNFRIVRVPIAMSADKRRWTDVVGHRADAFVANFEVAASHLAVNERSGGLLKIRVKSWATGAERLIDSPEAAYTMTLVATPGIDSAAIRYVYTSLTTPRTTYDLDVPTHRRRLRKVEPVLGGFDAGNYATEFLRAPARDGALVPVSLVYRKGTRLDGSAPLLQYGYGSYGHSTDPAFRSSWVSLLDRGFVVAIAHVRGGQELGRAWYEDGRLQHKRNTFTDFIDVTRFLVQRGYGAGDRIFAEGGSAGGLLMGAIANMAPRDYRAIIAYVPFVDVVTTMLDESIPLTTNEFDEWGNPAHKDSYDYMLSYSPYDNVSAQDYPALLVFTGLWDSQVQYYEPAKWVARLRAMKTDDHPLMLSVDMAAGHGGKAGRFQRFDNTALEYAFMLQLLKMDR
jgi:oligopeptidase B